MLLPDESSLPEVNKFVDWMLERLVARRAAIIPFDNYYEGDHNLVFATDKFRSEFGNLFEDFADNWCGVVVDSVEERLNVDGFRVADATGTDDGLWNIWTRNRMTAATQMANTDSLVFGGSYISVWSESPGEASLAAESPLETILLTDPGTGRRLAAIKTWEDSDGATLLTLYLPNGNVRLTLDNVTVDGKEKTKWVPRGSVEESWIGHDLGAPPIFPLPNRPRTRGKYRAGRSELAYTLPLQNAVNKIVADMLVASEHSGFRQRWATGITVPKDENGNAIEPFRAAVDRLWVSSKEGAEFGEFSQSDLTNFVKATEMLTQHIASQSRTPPHYFYLSGQFPSGESIKSAEAGLVAKCYRRHTHLGDGYEDAMVTAAGIEGIDLPPGGIDTVWRTPESRTEVELADAMVKQAALGVPEEMLWERLGYTPAQIRRMKKMRMQQSLRARLTPASSQPVGNTVDDGTADIIDAPSTEDLPALAAAGA